MRNCVVAILLCLPSAAASGGLPQAPIVVAVENDKSDCFDASGFCVVGLRGTTLGDLEVDTGQQVRYVGVAVREEDRQAVDHLLGWEILPDGSLLQLDVGSWSAPHPSSVWEPLEWLGAVRGPGGLAGLELFVTNDSYGVAYFGPSPTDGTDLEGRRASFQRRDSYENVTSHGETSSDEQVAAALRSLCSTQDCYDRQHAIADRYNATTPNLLHGESLDEVELAASSDALRGLDRDNAPVHVTPSREQAPAVLDAFGVEARQARPEADAAKRAPLAPLPRAPPPPPDPTSPALGGSPPKTAFPAAPSAHPAGILLAASFAVAIAASLLYSRVLGDEDRLHAGVRAALLATLERAGPQRLTTLARELGRDRKTIEYHARLLEKSGELQLLRTSDGSRIAALAGQTLPERRSRVAGSRACANVLAVIRQAASPLDREALATALPSMPRRTRDHALTLLVAEGLAIQEATGYRASGS